jgi:hypothetical protein
MTTLIYGKSIRQVLIGHEGRVMGADHIPAAVGGGSPQRYRGLLEMLNPLENPGKMLVNHGKTMGKLGFNMI